MGVSGQLHAPVALPSGNSPHFTNWIGFWVVLRNRLDATEKGKKSPFIYLPGNLTPIIQPLA
jgi:hypothetical protein